MTSYDSGCKTVQKKIYHMLIPPVAHPSLLGSHSMRKKNIVGKIEEEGGRGANESQLFACYLVSQVEAINKQKKNLKIKSSGKVHLIKKVFLISIHLYKT